MRVLIADRHDDVLNATRDLVGDFGGFEVVGTARDVDDTVRLVRELAPDLVLIDAWLKTGGAERAAARISEFAPRIAVAALTSEGEVELARRLHERGALGCFRKEQLAASLPGILAAVRA